MNTQKQAPSVALRRPVSRIGKYVPAADWLRHYQSRDLPGDLVVGAVVAIMLVPQAMAYAMLAGLPPQVGLYASMLPLPLLLYSLFGTSRTLTVGPVAIVSVLVAAALARIGPMDSAQAIGLALSLALAVGVVQLLMGILRLGFLVNFLAILSSPVSPMPPQ